MWSVIFLNVIFAGLTSSIQVYRSSDGRDDIHVSSTTDTEDVRLSPTHPSVYHILGSAASSVVASNQSNIWIDSNSSYHKPERPSESNRKVEISSPNGLESGTRRTDQPVPSNYRKTKSKVKFPDGLEASVRRTDVRASNNYLKTHPTVEYSNGLESAAQRLYTNTPSNSKVEFPNGLESAAQRLDTPLRGNYQNTHSKVEFPNGLESAAQSIDYGYGYDPVPKDSWSQHRNNNNNHGEDRRADSYRRGHNEWSGGASMDSRSYAQPQSYDNG